MCGVARQGAAGKALSAQGFVVVVGRPRGTFTENACRNRNSGQQNLELWGDEERPSRRMPVEQEFGATEFWMG